MNDFIVLYLILVLYQSSNLSSFVLGFRLLFMVKVNFHLYLDKMKSQIRIGKMIFFFLTLRKLFEDLDF